MTRLLARFSPVAGIQWVETKVKDIRSCNEYCFSPVAGIQWVETLLIMKKNNPLGYYRLSFSPVAGIQWVETPCNGVNDSPKWLFQSRCRDSVG